MIVFFGPAGAGKSVQGQILAARMGWRWLSSGQLLRESQDPEIVKQMQTGALVSDDQIIKIFGDALKNTTTDRVILDGFPRKQSQAEWLISNKTDHGRDMKLVIVMEVPKSELLKRMEARGRADDTSEAIDERLRIYRTEIYPILTFLTTQNINIVHINGVGTVGQVHDRIMEEIEAHNLG